MGKAFITTFSYDCEVAFNDKDGNSTDILPESVKCIIIDHDFKNRIMPIIYIKVSLVPSLYNKMVPQQGTSAKVYFKLFRTRNKGATSSSPKKIIYDDFDYFMTDDPNTYKKLDTINESYGSSYKECYIGLIKTEFQEKNKQTFEGVFKNTNTMSLVQNATSKLKMVIQPFKNNVDLESFACPTLTSIGQFVSYLNSQYSFYNGAYIYYMDFEKTYLRSNDGSYIDAEDGDFRYIAFDVRDLTAYNALTSGQVEDESQDAYILYVAASDAQITIDRVSSELNGQIVSVNTAAGGTVDTASVDTSAITSIASKVSANTLITSTDPNAATNVATRLAENTDTLTITKIDMDSRIFTPNKQYLLSNYEDNPKYCGVYYLVAKKEVYLRNGAQMSCQMTATLKKTADFI